jgi:hypothetical protein
MWIRMPEKDKIRTGNGDIKGKMFIKSKKTLIAAILILGFAAFLLIPGKFPDNPDLARGSNQAGNGKVLIIFNPGGWGDTRIEDAQDFKHIMEGVQNSLKNENVSSDVVTYMRTGDGFWSKLDGFKEQVLYFKNQSKILSGEIEKYLSENKEKKIILAGLSNGAAFINSTMEKLPRSIRDRVLVIEVGTPFWSNPPKLKNVLALDNGGKDALSKGKIGDLAASVAEMPFRWANEKMTRKNVRFSQVIDIPGHQYDWNAISETVNEFLKNNGAYN